MEWRVAGKFDAEHHHARYPEEENIRAGFENRGRVEILQIASLFGPTQCGEGPESRGEPGIQYVFILVNLVAVAM